MQSEPRWRTQRHRQQHFLKHGIALGRATADAFDQSARVTRRIGRRFTFTDVSTNEPRVGYYDLPARRLTVLTDDEMIIVTHFDCEESYVRRLPNSSYQR